MSHILLEQGIKRIALVDDSPDEVTLRSLQLRRVGFEPHPITQTYHNINDLVDHIAEDAQAAVCDNYLQPGGFDFYGAEAVAQLYDRGIPAVLITQFWQDIDVSIRYSRRKIPVVLGKDDAGPEQIAAGLDICLREQRNEILPIRRACRTIIKVVRIDNESSQMVVDALVLSWDAHCTVRFPASLLSEDLRAEISVGQYLIASVNTGADNPGDLFFYDFEQAPEPLSEDYFG